ncbi:glycosyltransferase [Nonlabens sp.]|uniref:glycosyltransferase n=1 Tax=Nonlabens sp. TaxID=1888209 RepID=UPI001BD02C86|nr:glycosyltransferase [Nonlabens sp.]
MKQSKSKFHEIVILAPISENKISGPLFSNTLLAKELSDKFNGKIQLISTKTKKEFCFNSINVQPANKVKITRNTILIFTGLYDISIFKLALKYKCKGGQLIFSPRGNITKKSLLKSIHKKILYFPIIYFVLKYSKKIHFLSELEFENSALKWLYKSKAISHPNPILFSEIKNIDRTLQPRDEIKCIFIGRYDIHHKGLDLLLKFVQKNLSSLKKHKIVFYLYGSNYRKGKEQLSKVIITKSLQDRIKLHDSITSPKVKNSVILNSDYFVHFSRYEGVPQSVIEAMNYKSKVIITTHCNITSQELGKGSILIRDNKDWNNLVSNIIANKDILECNHNLKTFSPDSFLKEIQ